MSLRPHAYGVKVVPPLWAGSPELWKGENAWLEHPGAGQCYAPEGTAGQLPSVGQIKPQASLGRVMNYINW